MTDLIGIILCGVHATERISNAMKSNKDAGLNQIGSLYGIKVMSSPLVETNKCYLYDNNGDLIKILEFTQDD